LASLSKSLDFCFNISIFSLISLDQFIKSFSFLQVDSSLVYSSFFDAISSFSLSKFSVSETGLLKLRPVSFSSLFFASNSISKLLIFLSKISKSTGFEIVFNFTEDNASSIKSIALSGNFLSGIYFTLSSTEATIAESDIFIP
jgi:hypothetical protein